MSCRLFQRGPGAVLLLPVAGGFTAGQVMALPSPVWASAVAGRVVMGG